MTSSHGQRVHSAFRPASWLTNPHAQTIFPCLPWAWRRPLALRREIVELPDGDATTADWAEQSASDNSGTPLLVILHGLEGSSDSTYARTLMHAALDRGWEACVLHFRDCGDYRNRLPRRYHAGETSDVRYFLENVAASSDRPILIAGFSLGGNVLLKYLGEVGADSPVGGAAAVCVPLDLQACSTALNKGFSKLYQRLLIGNMRKAAARKFGPDTNAFNWDRAMAAITFDEFDDAVTAPLHGFAGKDDYYGQCSSIYFLDRIRLPTLILNAADDPFMSPDMIPSETSLAESVTLEVSDAGGHVGFIEGGTPWQPRYYLPGRLLQYLGAYAGN